MKQSKVLLALILAMGLSTAFADSTTGSRSKIDNSATGARGGDAGSSPSTINAPSSTGQTGDGTPTTAYGNTDPKAVEGTTSIGTGVGSTPNGTSPKKGTTRSNAESSVTGNKEK